MGDGQVVGNGSSALASRNNWQSNGQVLLYKNWRYASGQDCDRACTVVSGHECQYNILLVKKRHDS